MEHMYGILIGGSLISALGAISTYSLEDKKPTIKSLSRDFIIGSIIFLLIMQLLPESSLSVVNYVSSLVKTSLPTLSTTTDDLDIQVGLPKF